MKVWVFWYRLWLGPFTLWWWPHENDWGFRGRTYSGGYCVSLGKLFVEVDRQLKLGAERFTDDALWPREEA